jgi:uncharacterized protein (TIGR00299 family) protein
MKILYIDQSSGVSGDMLNAALFGLHEDKAYLDSVVKALGLKGVSIGLSRKMENGIQAWQFSVNEESPEDHHHRGLTKITEIIQSADIGSDVKKTAIKAFTILAEAEAKVHASTVDEVHFHEVGAIDAICDIVCAAASLHWIAPDRILTSPFTLESGGTVKSAHGIIPVPVPAVMEIVAGRPTRTRDIQTEITTPTGAALIAAISQGYSAPDSWTPEKTSYGSGTKKLPFPNLVRAVLGRDEAGQGRTLMLETNIDDMNPQIIPEVIAGLLGIGCLDAWVTNILMKKSRPAWLFSIIVPETKLVEAQNFLLSSTPTIGVRWYPIERTCLTRSIIEKDTPMGKIRFKSVVLPDGTKREVPEFEDVKKTAERLGLPVFEVFQRI